MQHVQESWIAAAVAWARGTPEVLAIWLWGSRVSGWSRSGDPTREDSDLDLAVLYAGRNESERIGNAIFLSPALQDRLASLSGLTIDVQPIFESNEVVTADRVREGGMLIYSRDAQP